MSVAQDVFELVPTTGVVEPDANPAADADVGRDEESIGCGLDHAGLPAGRRHDPGSRPSLAVMGVCAGIGRKHLLHAKRRFPPRCDLNGFGQREADLSEAGQRRCGHFGDDSPDYRTNMADSNTFIALLRAVNVGGTGKLPMNELVALCTGLGFQDVQTYIQTGNVVFRTRLSEPKTKAAFEKALAAHMGKHFDVILRTADALRGVMDANPFPDGEGKQVMVCFCQEPVPTNALDGFVGPDGERAVATAREIYIHFPNGMGRSKFKMPGLKAVATTRNMNTVRKLVEMAFLVHNRPCPPSSPR